jgi:uncharacterized membrane protein
MHYAKLNPAQKEAVEQRAAAVEARTGVEVVVAFIGRCDHYPELPWKAFALASALAAVVVALAEWLRPDWIGVQHSTLALLAVLMTGALAALATVGLPQFARLFLDAPTAEAETRQFAAALFLERQWFRTAGRNCVLLLVAAFERKVVVLPDVGLREALPPARLAKVVAAMTPGLAQGEPAAALHGGLDALEALLVEAGHCGPKAANEVADVLVEEKGA